MSDHIELHLTHEESLDYGMLDESDAGMEEDQTIPLEPEIIVRKFVPKKRITAPTTRSSKPNPGGIAKKNYSYPKRTPAQARLGYRSNSTVHTNKATHTIHSIPTTEHTSRNTHTSHNTYTPKKTLLPRPTTTTAAPAAPTPFSLPPPPIIKMNTMTEHIQKELARAMIDQAKERYQIKLNENVIMAAILKAQEPIY